MREGAGGWLVGGHLSKQHDVYQSFTMEVEGGSTPPPSPSGRWDAVYYPAENVYRYPVPDCPQGRDGSSMRDS